MAQPLQRRRHQEPAQLSRLATRPRSLGRPTRPRSLDQRRHRQRTIPTANAIRAKSPGVNVRPIITIDGSHEVNDVFLENVRVPVENLIGEENKGWTYAKFLLGNERTSMAGIGRSMRYIE